MSTQLAGGDDYPTYTPEDSFESPSLFSFNCFIHCLVLYSLVFSYLATGMFLIQYKAQATSTQPNPTQPNPPKCFSRNVFQARLACGQHRKHDCLVISSCSQNMFSIGFYFEKRFLSSRMRYFFVKYFLNFKFTFYYKVIYI